MFTSDELILLKWFLFAVILTALMFIMGGLMAMPG